MCGVKSGYVVGLVPGVGLLCSLLHLLRPLHRLKRQQGGLENGGLSEPDHAAPRTRRIVLQRNGVVGSGIRAIGCDDEVEVVPDVEMDKESRRVDKDHTNGNLYDNSGLPENEPHFLSVVSGACNAKRG